MTSSLCYINLKDKLLLPILIKKKKVGATTWILHLNYQLVLHLIELNMDQIISVIKLSMEAKEHQLKSPQFSFIGD